jgi:hypothetical protein
LKDTQASNDITAEDPITLSDDKDMADPSEVTIVGVVDPLTAPIDLPSKETVRICSAAMYPERKSQD